MRTLATKIASFFSITNERGVTAIEYGMLAALISLGIIAGATLLGTNLTAIFDALGAQVKAP